MRWLYILPLRLRSLFRRAEVDADLEDELRSHLDHRIAHEIAAGRTPAEARQAARGALFGIAQRKEQCRDARRTAWFDDTVRDIRYALRALKRTPGFTIAACSALALGIGANTAVFSVVNAILLRPLPFHDPHRLVLIFDSFQQQGIERGPASMADFLDWRARARSFQSIEGFSNGSITITGQGDAQQIASQRVTSGFFDALAIRPILGRTFSAGDDHPGAAPTLVISERLWLRLFSADPAISGKTVAVNGQPHTILGVMPSSFPLASAQTEAWAPLTLTPPTRRGPFFIRGVARLKPGVSIEQAAAEMNTIAALVEQANPKDYIRLRFPLQSIPEAIVGDIRQLLLILAGAVMLVLLIAVSNVANLLLARATARQREIGIRLSIGASRGRLIRQFMTESLLLSFTGGAAGVLLAYWGVAALRTIGPSLPRKSEIVVDANTLAFTLAISILSALLFGLFPALAASNSRCGENLKDGARAGESRTHGRLRAILVVAQITLSVFLLIGAGLLIRSFNLLGRVDTGFHAPPSSVLTVLVTPIGTRYPNRDAVAAYWRQLLLRIQALPGVEAATVAVTIPPNRVAYTDGYQIEGKPAPPGTEYPAVPCPVVGADYLKTLGIPLLRGRFFDSRDRGGERDVTVISETMARMHFPGENPIGRRLKHGHSSLNNPYMEIIGVVGDVKYQGLEGETPPVYYEYAGSGYSSVMWLLVRAKGDASALLPSVRAEIRAVDPAIPIARAGTMAEALSESVALPRFRSLLMTVFATVALLLAAIGIYGVVAYSVTQRTQEIGVRMALGASGANVLQLVVGQGGRLALIGVVLGLIGAAAVTKVMKKLLFQIEPADTTTFAAAAVVLGTVALAASLLPALRAARINPVVALRNE
ncbi:MAG: ABC transporter permease [Acidobacteria bacterium]|nr:ABC transporter permease [Acidobacteriota bacterium]